MTNLTIIRGDTSEFDHVVSKKDGSGAYDLTGAVLRFMAKRSYKDLDAAAVISEDTAGGGVVITDAAAGKATTSIDAADTASFPDRTVELVWDLQVEQGGKKFTADRGVLFVEPDVVRV
jgi:hypothetical protein